MSETGSLDRMKAAAERRKKGLDDSVTTVSERVEGTRVNPESLIGELLANTELLESGESMFNQFLLIFSFFKKVDQTTKMIIIFSSKFSATGLQLYISSDGTTSLGNHEVKNMAGSVFKKVVMESPR